MTQETSVSENTVRIWHLSLRDALLHKDYFWLLLSENEKNRANRFRFARDRGRFVLARGILRCLAGQLLGQSPEALRFSYTDSGKPFLRDYPRLQFNLSHSRDRVVYAFTLDTAVGVDIEYKDPQCDVEGIAQRFFAAQEFAALQKLRDAEKGTAFFKLWVRKEALLKASGYGFSWPLTKIVFRPDQHSFRLSASNREIQPLEWTLHALNLVENFAAALAIRTHSKRLEIRSFSELLSTTT